jgi:hypothetical protein
VLAKSRIAAGATEARLKCILKDDIDTVRYMEATDELLGLAWVIKR